MKLHILQLSFANITTHEYQAIRNRQGLKESTKKKLNDARSLSLQSIQDILNKFDLQYISQNSKYYPPLLNEIHDPPYVLYVKGNLNILNTSIFGIVGSRKASIYTKTALTQILKPFSDITIISGLAYGADDMAHLLALEYGLNTIGVLAFGHDIHYPKTTENTRKCIEKYGVTISEFPPGTKIRKHQFISRNRIIAGCSLGVLVTEAEERSGSLITLDMALDENRLACCIPGNITSKLSIGTNQKIKEGATVVSEAQDIFDNLLF